MYVVGVPQLCLPQSQLHLERGDKLEEFVDEMFPSLELDIQLIEVSRDVDKEGKVAHTCGIREFGYFCTFLLHEQTDFIAEFIHAAQHGTST